VRIPDYELFNAVGRVIMFSEAFAIHEKDYRERPLDFGKLTFTRMILGALTTGADLTQAYRLRRELAVAVNHDLLKRYDAILCASALAPAARFDSMSDAFPPNWPIQTMPFNVTGNPAMSMPAGFSASGLPLSVQIVGRPFDEPMVLRIGATLERLLGLTGLRPALAELRQAA
jgi:aspartyl-tRNA(Asn)/glutamyl-tRNA(Gln) amidotransferase subunit A